MGVKVRILLLKIRIIYIDLLRKFKIIKPGEIFYIGGSEALPPPLSIEEETFLVNHLKKQNNNSIKSVLIERNLRLVVYIARKFENTGIGVEDLISIGTIGLIKAVNTFDPDKNIKLPPMLKMYRK